MAREINLVPSSKFETIKAIRIRNFLLFLSIVVAGGAIGVVFVLGTILGGQNLILGGKDDMLKLYSQKITSYTELTDSLTIKDQLGQLKTLADNKTLFSRTFDLLPVFIPTNGDEMSFSKIEVGFNSNTVSLGIAAQANALTEPYIDYNVLDSFKKSMDYYRYDYGTYVNEEGDEIPNYCIVEKDDSGSMLIEDNKYYAYWTINVDGCDPKHPVDLLSEEETEEDTEDSEYISSDTINEDSLYEYLSYKDQRVVKIWRTPQFKDWYEKQYMTIDGSISGVPHFESKCISYSGNLDESANEPYFDVKNDDCKLVPEGIDGFTIDSSSNSRGQNRELVLSFKGTILVDSEFFKMQNAHMIAIGPTGRHNVTDSYTQVQSLFVAPADACDIDDVECRNGGK